MQCDSLYFDLETLDAKFSGNTEENHMHVFSCGGSTFNFCLFMSCIIRQNLGVIRHPQ